MNFPSDGETDGYVKNYGTMLKVQHSLTSVDFVQHQRLPGNQAVQ
jgi:hypothetical protein